MPLEVLELKYSFNSQESIRIFDISNKALQDKFIPLFIILKYCSISLISHNGIFPKAIFIFIASVVKFNNFLTSSKENDGVISKSFFLPI